MSGKTSMTWTKHRQACARNTFSLGTWTQARLKDNGLSDEDLCQLCRAERGTLFHRRFRCEAFLEDRG
eukprot:4574690-Pyramimonas_sp.AAC.1